MSYIPRARHHRLAERNQRIALMRGTGLTHRAIAARVGVSEAVVYYVLKTIGAPLGPNQTKPPGPGRGHRAPDPRIEARNNEWARRVAAGDLMTAIACEYGVSREAVRKIVLRYGITAHAVKRERREAADLERRTKVCKVCGSTFMATGRRLTCSDDCAAANAIRRFKTAEGHEDHRRHQARTILRRPDHYGPSKVAWAHRMLSDDPPPPNRRFVKKGGQAERLANLGLIPHPTEPCNTSCYSPGVEPAAAEETCHQLDSPSTT